MMMPFSPWQETLSRLLTHPAVTQVLVELGQKAFQTLTKPPEPTRAKPEKPEKPR